MSFGLHLVTAEVQCEVKLPTLDIDWSPMLCFTCSEWIFMVAVDDLCWLWELVPLFRVFGCELVRNCCWDEEIEGFLVSRRTGLVLWFDARVLFVSTFSCAAAHMKPRSILILLTELLSRTFATASLVSYSLFCNFIVCDGGLRIRLDERRRELG